jgi:hypothetical protein
VLAYILRRGLLCLSITASADSFTINVPGPLASKGDNDGIGTDI